MRLLPPLTISDEQADAVLDRLSDAVEAVARDHTSHGVAHRPGHERDRHSDHTARAG